MNWRFKGVIAGFGNFCVESHQKESEHHETGIMDKSFGGNSVRPQRADGCFSTELRSANTEGKWI
jgi:hypothetical protein